MTQHQATAWRCMEVQGRLPSTGLADSPSASPTLPVGAAALEGQVDLHCGRAVLE